MLLVECYLSRKYRGSGTTQSISSISSPPWLKPVWLVIADLTRHVLCKKSTWTNQRDYGRGFVSFCLLSVLSKSGNRVPRPLFTNGHAYKLKRIIYFSRVFLGKRAKDDKYAPAAEESLSGYFVVSGNGR